MNDTYLIMYAYIYIFELMIKSITNYLFTFFIFQQLQLHVSQIDKNGYSPFCDETLQMLHKIQENRFTTHQRALLGVGVLNPLEMIWFCYNMHLSLTPAWAYLHGNDLQRVKVNLELVIVFLTLPPLVHTTAAFYHLDLA